jgi:predicted helicase
MMLFEPEQEYGKEGKKPNIAPIVFEQLEKAYDEKPTPEQILYYCYAVLYSKFYREKYAEFLKIDFPRIPFTADFNLFKQMAKLGEELGQLHLLKSKALNNPAARYLGSGEDIIEKLRYDEKNQRVFINETKFFEGVSKAVWEYRIGGYQIAKKFLEWRKGRKADDRVYCQVITAISNTLLLQEKIDILFEEVAKGTPAF